MTKTASKQKAAIPCLGLETISAADSVLCLPAIRKAFFVCVACHRIKIVGVAVFCSHRFFRGITRPYDKSKPSFGMLNFGLKMRENLYFTNVICYLTIIQFNCSARMTCHRAQGYKKIYFSLPLVGLNGD
jgi:hypothetical protein